MGLVRLFCLSLRVWFRERDTLVATLATGSLSVLCLFAVPVWGSVPDSSHPTVAQSGT
jgi:hypothetical protein